MKSKKVVQYSLLTLILVSFIFAISQVNSSGYRFILVLATTLVYFLFGILHHLEEKNLTGKIVLEYAAISLLILITLYTFFIGNR